MSNPENKNWLVDYLFSPDAFDLETQQHGSIPEFQKLVNNQIIIGSGSPRNPRYLKTLEALQGFSAVCFSDSAATQQLKQKGFTKDTPEREIADLVESYQEPRGQWSASGDNGLSLSKARLILASILLLEESNKPFKLSFAVLARDYNIASNEGHFLDKSILWGGLGPVDQYDLLYNHGPRPFFITNATTLLKVSPNQALTIKNIQQVFDPTQPLPEWLRFQTIYTYMALQPDEKITIYPSEEPSIRRLLTDGFAQSPFDAAGHRAYKIPGIIDWSKQPFIAHLQVWKPALTSVISQDFSALQASVTTHQGEWTSFTSQTISNPHLTNELVGTSTFGLQQILKSNLLAV